MNLITISSSARKGKTTDTLVDKAIEGFKLKAPDAKVRKIYLMDQDIRYCRNCLKCHDNKEPGPKVECVIKDDYNGIADEIVTTDAVLLATPIHMSFVSAPMMTFLERVCWTFAKPEGRALTVVGCPAPREPQTKKKAAFIMTTSLVPPIYRKFCDNATELFRDTSKYAINAKIVGDLYAGALVKRGLEPYLEKARRLGMKLA